MLSQPERLKKQGLFQRVYSAKKSISCEGMTLYVLARDTYGARRLPHVGFVISKKVLARATDRNRAKRRVREAYRKLRTTLVNNNPNTTPGIEDPETKNLQEKINLQQWYALVWVLKETVLEKPFAEIIETIKNGLFKANEKYGQKYIKINPGNS